MSDDTTTGNGMANQNAELTEFEENYLEDILEKHKENYNLSPKERGEVDAIKEKILQGGSR